MSSEAGLAMSVPAPSWFVIDWIACVTTSTSVHPPGSKHAVSTVGERSVSMVLTPLNGGVSSA